MRIVVAAPLLILTLVACHDGSAGSAQSRNTPTAPGDVYSYCFDEGKAAGDRIEPNGWGPSPEYTRFTNLLDGLSDSLLPATDSSVADWFVDAYRGLAGKPAWVNTEARGAFDRALADCGQRHGVDLTAVHAGLAPSFEIRLRTLCVAKAAFDAEARFGEDSLAYTPAYLTYLHDHTDEDDPQNYLETERDYAQATGESPFSRPEAVAAFRASALPC